MNKRNNRSGFTLVELAIVLVIIGLIVGGVLVGQDLIKAATVRAAVSQLERYDTAANTFRNKYNGLPGDLSNPRNFFGGFESAAIGGNGTGDNDGLVEGISAVAVNVGTPCTLHTCITGEAAMFWTQLNRAGLSTDATNYSDPANVTPTINDDLLPQSKLGRGSRVAVHSFSGRNYYLLLGGSGGLVAGTTAYTAGLAPIDALQIDTKMDDAIPSTGKVISVAVNTALATTAGNGTAPGSATATTCYVTSTPPAYATTSYAGNTNTDSIVCSLSVRTSF